MNKKFHYFLLLSILAGIQAFVSTLDAKVIELPEMELSRDKFKVRWDKVVHDFGTIEKDSGYSAIFVLKNIGIDPLVIVNVLTPEGSWNTSYNHEPIPKGKTTNISISFSTVGKNGYFTKGVTIIMNGGSQELIVKGFVAEKVKIDSLPEVEWDHMENDFGDINAGEKVGAIFQVTNHGTKPLIIENIQSSCGCVVSNWTEAPILQGKDADITVKFNSKGKHGKQERSVTVYTNKGLFILHLKANIIP